jgi:hypothetical protein
MRINMSVIHATVKPPRSLLDIWCHMLASEYLVEPKTAVRWLHERNSRAFVVDFLKSKGWKVDTYTTPDVEGHASPPSHGYVISDDCVHFVAWRLSQGA